MNGADKLLRQIDTTLSGNEWPHGMHIIKEMLARCKQPEVLEVIDELMEHVRTMGVSKIFRPDRYPMQVYVHNKGTPRLNIDTIGNGNKLSEVGYRRTTLLIELQRIRNAFLTLFDALANVRLQIEETNMEFDGTHVPKPSAEELAKQNVIGNPA